MWLNTVATHKKGPSAVCSVLASIGAELLILKVPSTPFLLHWYMRLSALTFHSSIPGVWLSTVATRKGSVCSLPCPVVHRRRILILRTIVILIGAPPGVWLSTVATQNSLPPELQAVPTNRCMGQSYLRAFPEYSYACPR